MAAAAEEVGRALLGGRIGGRHSGMAMARAGLRIETGELKKLNNELEVTRKTVQALRKEMDQLATSSAKAVGSARGLSGVGGGSRAQNGMPLAPPAPGSPSATTGFAPTAAAAAGGGGGGGGRVGALGMFGGSGAGAYALGAVAVGAIAPMVGALDNRIARGAEYAANADRLNVIQQQQYGMSQNQVMNQLRKPLTNYRLGQTGVNDLMQFQIQTGVQMNTDYASSVAGIRALNGYTKTTADVLADQRSVMDPTVANRMFNMLGVNAYTYGGAVNDPMKMRQQIVQQMGLTNSLALRGAKTPGSVTRARLTDAGVPLELQDEILTYAESNLSYQKKGGKGMYDPTDPNQRKFMGIEQNFATQQEESERLRGAREENFARRQLDNLAQQEKTTQALIKALNSLEDKLSTLVGARTGWGNIMKIGGRIMQGVGAGLAVTGVGTGAGIAMMGVGTALAGDPPEGSGSGGSGANTGSTNSANDANIMIPVGYNGGRQSLNAVKQRPDFRSMKPQMQERLLSMFRANPNVGIGGGYRDSKSQEQMFRSRYRPTSKKTSIFWQGTYWEHVSGAAAAPPGRSMHEIGLAADLVGDLKWMNANAGKFGLKHFAGVNNEPWHVQPSELPNSRREYEKGGAAWGSDGGFDESAQFGSGTPVTTGAEEDSGHGHGGNIGGMSLRSFSNMSISEILDMMASDGLSRLMAGGGEMTERSSTTKVGGTEITTGAVPAGSMKGEDVARAAYGAGFRKEDLIKMVAIAKRESRWNPRAYNGNLGTGDQSYGLWQLNTLNSKKGGMMGDLFNEFLGKPKGNKNFDELFDPNTNARGAHFLYQRNGNTLRPWGGYKGVSDTHGADQYIAEATTAVKNANLGDPIPDGGAPMGHLPMRTGPVSVSHAPTYQITVSPQISFVGMPSTPDLKKIAQEVTTLIDEQVRTLAMRGA